MEKRKNIATKKSMVVQFVLLGICTAGTAFSQTLALKANIGVCACWDAVGLNVYQIFGIKVGTVSMCLHAVCVLVQFLIQRKDFEKRKILQLPYVIVFGMLLNFFYYNVLTFEVHAYAAKVLLVIMSYLGLGLFLGPMLLLNLITIPSEAMCNVISGYAKVDYANVRIGLDGVCIAASLMLSFLGGVSLKVREGTVMGMLLLGPLEKLSMKVFEPQIKRVKDIK